MANQRNGKSAKTVLTEDGPLRLDIPRDRNGSFYPILVPKHERRFTGIDDKIIAMYARGMTVQEIQAFLAEQYGTELSPEFIIGRIGNVVPPDTAKPIVEMMDTMLLLAETGETFVLSATPMWVRPVAVALSVAELPEGCDGLFIDQAGDSHKCGNESYT